MSARSVAVRQRIEYRVARAFSALPPRLQVRLSGGKPIVIDGQTLEPDLQLTLALIERQGLPPMETLTPEQARRVTLGQSRGSQGPPVPVGAVGDLRSPAPRARCPPASTPRRSDGRGPRRCCVFFHGGGFVVGGLDTHDGRAGCCARHAGVHVLRVEYRLAPEHPFPAAVDDADAAFAWARAHARRARRRPRRDRRRRRQRRRQPRRGRRAGRARRRPDPGRSSC